MKAVRYRYGWIHAGVLMAALAAVQAQAQPLAMITDLTATCRIQDAKGERDCALLDSLVAGNELRFSGDGHAVVVYFSGNEQLRFDAPARLRIEAKGPEVLEGAKARSSSLGKAGATGLSALRGMNLAQAALVMRGTAKKRLRLISPVDTVVIDSDRPSFRWESRAPDAQYRFALTHESGRRVLETLVRGESFQLPPELVLEPEVFYEWQVETRLASGDSYSGSADFSIASDQLREELAALRPGPSATVSDRVIYTAVLESHGAYQAAKAQWRALLQERPGNPALTKLAK